MAAGDYELAVGADSGQELYLIVLGPPLVRPPDGEVKIGVEAPTVTVVTSDDRRLEPRGFSGRPGRAHDLAVISFEAPPGEPGHLEVRFVAKTGGVGDPVEHHIQLRPLG
jgi:hypothetical protein